MHDANQSLEPLAFENVKIISDKAYKRIVELRNNRGISYLFHF